MLAIQAVGLAKTYTRAFGRAPQEALRGVDLAVALGAALAVARVQAQGQAGGEADLAELLDYARVAPAGGSFTMELALPQAFLERHLADCGRRGPRARAAGTPPAAPPAGPTSAPTSAPGIE